MTHQHFIQLHVLSYHQKFGMQCSFNTDSNCESNFAADYELSPSSSAIPFLLKSNHPKKKKARKENQIENKSKRSNPMRENDWQS